MHKYAMNRVRDFARMIEVYPWKSCLFTSPLAPLRGQRGERGVFCSFCSLPCLRGRAGDGVIPTHAKALGFGGKPRTSMPRTESQTSIPRAKLAGAGGGVTQGSKRSVAFLV